MASPRISTIADHLKHPTDISQANMVQKVFQLIPGVQSYDWGIVGASSSRVAQFAAATTQLDFHPQADKPYAELWMGTHASLPSRAILSSGTQDLSSYLAAHPQLIGERVSAKFADEQPGCLPFLFKVLSVGKALSIQAHPDKALGKRLHAARPDVYRDPNHKPEMAVALTAFRGFCGFRLLEEIARFVGGVPEFAQLVKVSRAEVESAAAAAEAQKKAVLKTIFANLMNSPQSAYAPLAAQLAQRFSQGPVEGVPEQERKLVLKLAAEFPEDVGIFCTFLLNISTLQPGQALFLQANEPHAYLEGEILECMASSDNVVRAGLTPKLRDTDTLVEMCTYQSGSDRGRLAGERWAKSSPAQVEALLYDPPIEEFSVVTTRLGEGGVVRNKEVGGPSIVIVLDGSVLLKEDGEAGEGLRLERGQLAFVGAGVEVVFSNVGAGEVGLARAFVEA
ncbi:probable PMI40-mannose-6-phosphate isomerase [Sporisorium reilianum SRZ2]|uniref:Mannose-6-phosphate isomerase n=1 Tax=Sporisorium reilianum (strain SRZ2) TaxID=999809 RepID=E6ZW30_SPORE|nr:probable PMI40-mannose-6-phosphate isomerase [Sporisorium reilianum SRZ2]